MNEGVDVQFDNEETAIVLVEFQKQWTERGLLHRLIKGQLASRNVVKNTRRLVTTAREHGVTIIHAPLILDPHNKKGWLAYPTLGRFFTKDSWKSELVPGVFEDGDPIAARGYYNYQAFDAFYKSELEQTLAEHNIQTMFICGFATDQCPAKTMKTAIRKGISPYLVGDCTATFLGFLQTRAESKENGARTVTSQEVMAAITE